MILLSAGLLIAWILNMLGVYDFFMVDERHVAVFMADVSGKGVPSALFMAIAKAMIKDHTEPEKQLNQTFSKGNNLLCESNSEGLFVTGFRGCYDPNKRICTYKSSACRINSTN